jgi:hypothetical protein
MDAHRLWCLKTKLSWREILRSAGSMRRGIATMIRSGQQTIEYAGCDTGAGIAVEILPTIVDGSLGETAMTRQ